MDEFLRLVGANASGGALVMLITFAVMAVWRGWLVPRGTIEKLETAQQSVVEIQEKRLDEAVARENEWRKAYETAHAANVVLAGHVNDVLALLGTASASVAATERLVRDMAARTPGGGGGG